jgi:hypothetical protein
MSLGALQKSSAGSRGTTITFGFRSTFWIFVTQRSVRSTTSRALAVTVAYPDKVNTARTDATNWPLFARQIAATKLMAMDYELA